MSTKPCRSRIVLKCEKMEQAQIMQQVLAVDEELQPHKLVITYSTNADLMTEEGPQLIIDVEAADLKMLRIGVSSALDMVLVGAKTLLQFQQS